MKLTSLLLLSLLAGSASSAHADAGPHRPAAHDAQLRSLLLEHFDKNGDGRLGPRERQRAARTLHRIAVRLTRSAHEQEQREQPRGKIMRRYDLNRDGNVGPGEMPPAIADELRPLDTDGDGWLERGELP